MSVFYLWICISFVKLFNSWILVIRSRSKNTSIRGTRNRRDVSFIIYRYCKWSIYSLLQAYIISYVLPFFFNNKLYKIRILENKTQIDLLFCQTFVALLFVFFSTFSAPLSHVPRMFSHEIAYFEIVIWTFLYVLWRDYFVWVWSHYFLVAMYSVLSVIIKAFSL